MFQCFNVASISPAISFRSFDVSHRRRWGVYYYFNTQFLPNFGVLCCHWKWSFIPFRTMFQCFNVAMVQYWTFGCSIITVLFAVGTKLLFIVYKLGTHFTQRSAALLNKRWSVTYTKSGRFIALKVVTCLHQKRLFACIKDGQFIALKAAAF